MLRATVIERCAVGARRSARASDARRLRDGAVCSQRRRSAALRTPLPDVAVARLARSSSSRTPAGPTSTARRRSRLRVDGRRGGGHGREVPGRRDDGRGWLRVPDGRR